MKMSLDLDNLESVTGGTGTFAANWTPAVVTSLSPDVAEVGFYRSAKASPDAIIFPIKPGDKIFVLPDSAQAGWIKAKARGVVQGFVEEKYVEY